MIQVTSEILNQGRETLISNGYRPSKSEVARQKFTPADTLQLGTYTPLISGPQVAVNMPARTKNGSDYDAIPFKVEGRDKPIEVSLGSIFNSIRVVEGMDPADFASDAKWAGEEAMPTKNYFRYGNLSNMESDSVLNKDTLEKEAVYVPVPFTLDAEVVIVAPRFVAGQVAPVFDTQCRLRKVTIVKDYQKFPDDNARRQSSCTARRGETLPPRWLRLS